METEPNEYLFPTYADKYLVDLGKKKQSGGKKIDSKVSNHYKVDLKNLQDKAREYIDGTYYLVMLISLFLLFVYLFFTQYVFFLTNLSITYVANYMIQIIQKNVSNFCLALHTNVR